MIDYYEFLQISPHAEADTVHRVYRFLAARLHPDNPESGDAKMFHLLKKAYDVLSDPESRAEYDASRKREQGQPAPLSTSVDFMDSLDGELNRRLAVLAVLYSRRRTNPHKPEVSLLEIETRMGFPRDYLDFTTWYLMKKGYIARADNSDFTLSADGVDFVESQRGSIPVLNKMLTSGTGIPGAEVIHAAVPVIDVPRASKVAAVTSGPIVLPASMDAAPEPVAEPAAEGSLDRRKASKDRRVSVSDPRVNGPERRVNTTERRVAAGRRRAADRSDSPVCME